MAATVTITTINSGEKYFTKHIAITGDAAGEVTAQELFSAAEIGTAAHIDSIEFQTAGTAAVIKWAATAPTVAVVLPADCHGRIDYRNVGGLPSNAGAGKTGVLTLTTVGLVATDYLTATIVVRKS